MHAAAAMALLSMAITELAAIGFRRPNILDLETPPAERSIESLAGDICPDAAGPSGHAGSRRRPFRPAKGAGSRRARPPGPGRDSH